MSEERVEVQLKRLADKTLSKNGNDAYRLSYGEKLAHLVLETLDGAGGRSPNHESEPQEEVETPTKEVEVPEVSQPVIPDSVVAEDPPEAEEPQF